MAHGYCREAADKQIVSLQSALAEAKRKAGEISEEAFEEVKKKAAKEVDELQVR